MIHLSSRRATMWQRRQTGKQTGRRASLPRLELLEDRLVPAVFNVNSVADILAPPAGVVTLRSAIQSANATPGGNIINLTIAGTYQITLAGTPGETDNAAGEFAILPSGGNLTIQNTSGGPVAVDGGGLNNRVFDINPADANAGVLVTMSGFTIRGGIATSPGTPDGPNASGGGIRDQGNASLTLNNMVLADNSATADGGGISMENVVSALWTLTLNKTRISDNHAGDAGGGVDTDGTGTVFINAGCLIDGNTDLNQGAGVYLDAIAGGSANLTVTDTVVRANASTGSGTGIGGGISNAGSGIVVITNSTIRDNFAAFTGGGFSDENNGLGTLAISNSLFVNNSAGGNGGALFMSGPSFSIADTEVRGNSSGGSGGGLFDGGVTMDVVDSTFSGNTASGNGGGLEVQTTGSGSSGSAITNTTIVHDRALNNAGGNTGGGIDASGTFTGSLVLLSDTITGNYADTGGGLFWAGASGTVTVQNTVIALNIVTTAGPDAANPAGTFTDNGGNLIGVSGMGSGNTGFTAGTTQTGTLGAPLNPQLGFLQNNGGPTVGANADPGTLGTEVPLSFSPLIGKGVAAGAPTTDQRGYFNPGTGPGGAPDVGAVAFLTAQERFVQALYLDELGRPGTLAELDGWVAVLNGSGGQHAVAAGIAGSAEARDHLVKGWYLTYLGRAAMNGEEQGWVTLLATETEEQVLSKLLASGEFYAHAQTLGFSGTPDSQFVQALYSLLLNRTPSSAEITGWVNLLPTVGRQGVALGFLDSQEYRMNTVEAYYISLLHRQADPLGLNHWVTANLDLASIRVDIESSGEFFNDG
jgi:Domain of unknown function (DUF4214)